MPALRAAMGERPTGPVPPTPSTIEKLQAGVALLRAARGARPSVSGVPRERGRERAGPAVEEVGSTSPEAALQRFAETLATLHDELVRLAPWFEEFVGSSLVVNLATKAVDEPLAQIRLHRDRLHEPAPQTLQLVVPSLGRAAERTARVLDLLPGHLRLARRLSARERGFWARVASLPPRLRRRFYLGVALGSMLLASVAFAFAALLVPPVEAVLGVSELLQRYASTSAGVVVVALLFFTGARLLLGSVWLTRTMSILPSYEEKRLDAARRRIRLREEQVLGSRGPDPRASGPPAPEAGSGSGAGGPPVASLGSELGEHRAEGPGVVD